MRKGKPVFHELGFSETKGLALTFKADLYTKILDVVRLKKLSPRDLEKKLNVPQPRASELLNGKLSGMSIEKLLTYLELLGVSASLSFKPLRAG